MNLDNSFCCYLLSVITLNIFVLRKHRLVFELCDYFNFSLSFLGAVSIKTRRQRLFVGYNIMSVTVLCSTNSLFVLILLLFNLLSITAYFLSSDCFLVVLWLYWQVQFKVNTLKMMPNSFKAEMWARCTHTGFESLLEFKFCQFFCKFKLINHTKCIFIFDKLKDFVKKIIYFALIWRNEYFL